MFLEDSKHYFSSERKIKDLQNKLDEIYAENMRLKKEYEKLHMDYIRERELRRWSEKSIRNLIRKNKHLYTKCHIYKIEMNRYRRKLTRIYERIYQTTAMNHYDSITAENTVKYWKGV